MLKFCLTDVKLILMDIVNSGLIYIIMILIRLGAALSEAEIAYQPVGLERNGLVQHRLPIIQVRTLLLIIIVSSQV